MLTTLLIVAAALFVAHIYTLFHTDEIDWEETNNETDEDEHGLL